MTSVTTIAPNEHNEEDDIKFCEGLGGYQKATERLDLPIGEDRSILLFLCNKCSEKIQGHKSS